MATDWDCYDEEREENMNNGMDDDEADFAALYE
jgi:hypothetical protein